MPNPDILFRILPVFFIFFGLIFVAIIAVMISIKRKNDRSPIVTVKARVSSKRIETKTKTWGAMSPGKPRPKSRFRCYYLTFFIESEGGDRSFSVGRDEYEQTPEGASGELSYQGGRYLGFRPENES